MQRRLKTPFNGKWHKTMKKITLKRLPLLSIALFGVLFSSLSLANSPWASEDTAKPTTENSVTETTPTTASQTTQGDVLNVEPNTTVTVQVIDFPRRGMTTDKVQNELGRPNEIVPAVGTPPISRWVYDDRTVYFERSSVIHVVAK